LATLDKAAHRRNGPFLRLDVGCLLRGQRQAIAALEGAASFHLLAATSNVRRSTHRSCAFVAPAGATTEVLICHRDEAAAVNRASKRITAQIISFPPTLSTQKAGPFSRIEGYLPCGRYLLHGQETRTAEASELEYIQGC
jgi:hypothetical protein